MALKPSSFIDIHTVQWENSNCYRPENDCSERVRRMAQSICESCEFVNYNGEQNISFLSLTLISRVVILLTESYSTFFLTMPLTQCLYNLFYTYTIYSWILFLSKEGKKIHFYVEKFAEILQLLQKSIAIPLAN